MAHTTAKACALTLQDEVVLRYGVPQRLISDNKGQFVGAVMQKLTHCLGISQSPVPIYHPQANPCERKNRDFKTQLAILVGDQHSKWPQQLPSIRFAMNSTRCAGTGYTPAYLAFAREMRFPDDAERDLRSVVVSENFVTEVTPRLLVVADILRKANEVYEGQQDRNKARYDPHHRADPEYAPGDFILVTGHTLSNAAKGRTSKFDPRRNGPYVITSFYPTTLSHQGSGGDPLPTLIIHKV